MTYKLILYLRLDFLVALALGLALAAALAAAWPRVGSTRTPRTNVHNLAHYNRGIAVEAV